MNVKNDDFKKIKVGESLAGAGGFEGRISKVPLTFFYLYGKILTWNSDISVGCEAAGVSLVTQLAGALPLK